MHGGMRCQLSTRRVTADSDAARLALAALGRRLGPLDTVILTALGGL